MLAAPAAMVIAAGADVHREAEPVAAPAPVPPPLPDAPDYKLEVVASGPAAGPADLKVAPGQMASVSNWRVADRAVRQALPVGVASERGLQVKTILVARSVSAVFPEIRQIGGVRADALRWHPDGLAVDVMIPNPSSAEGIALGNQIVAYVIKNAERFGMQDAIWRGVYYTPNGPRGSGNGHFDHVHITTTGGGYPTGSETYFR
ncbi:hypothetical protein MLIT_37190 [Mycolicibacterium litorale]|uniref:ARB-07466-like C-terminal domain-containing protein n=2 Tax=Mycolicibacterium litorale TaxID=758802 RepID=A0AAD1IRC4_9MYCO|nr:hypothetical protein BCL50_3476 [Mycolicibacterium litorale]BBY18127.1 hypothetical protein MLIT_37190 [Mycolicibacterium litorale]